MTTSLTRRQELTPAVWEMVTNIAPIMHKSRLFGVSNEDQAAAIMLKGYELGLSLTAAFEFIHVIQNKPTLSPRGALALIYQSGELEGIKIEDDGKVCKVWMKRKNGVEHTAAFGMDDAKTAGLIKSGGGWETYPRQLRQWRAVGFCADVVFPDLIGGMKRSDELGATVTADGDVIEGSWTTVEREEPTQPRRNGAADPSALLFQLADTYGVDAVIAANDGVLPATVDEVEAVAAKLNGGDS